MTEKEIFEYLLEISETSSDPRGVVSACLVRDGEILLGSPSSNDGVLHAENIIIPAFRESPDSNPEGCILYSTLVPCSKRTNPIMRACTNVIIDAGIKEVIYGAKDPEYTERSINELKEQGIHVRQTTDKEIIKKCAELFNSTLDKSLAGSEINLKPLD